MEDSVESCCVLRLKCRVSVKPAFLPFSALGMFVSLLSCVCSLWNYSQTQTHPVLAPQHSWAHCSSDFLNMLWANTTMRHKDMLWKKRAPAMKKNNAFTFSNSPSNFVFHHPLIIGCLNWNKHACTCHCHLNPSQVSSSPAGSFTSRLFLKTGCFRLSSLSGAGKSWPAARSWNLRW